LSITEFPKQLIDSYTKKKNNTNNNLLLKKRKNEKCNIYNNFTSLESSVENQISNIGNLINSVNSGNSRNSKNTNPDYKYQSDDLIPQRVSGDFDYINSRNLYMVNNEKIIDKDLEYNEYGTSEQGECASGTSNFSDFVNFI
jgi:hypothetical protein